jgi:hypothetical protein
MSRFAAAVLALLAALAPLGQAAESESDSSAAGLADSMRQAKLSDGFEARMNIVTVDPGGRRGQTIKVAVIGQFGTDRQRLMIRGISPNSVRNRFLVAERIADGPIRAIEYRERVTDGVAETDPQKNQFDAGLVMWDMFSPWWSWPKQTLGGTERMAGRDCRIVRSRDETGISPVREVVSCVDKGAGLSLRTQLFDSRRTLLRTISVERTIRRESGLLAAKKLTVAAADNTVTEIEVYGGDEHYAISAETFAPLDHPPAAGK